MGALLGFFVHDLRNPSSSIMANVDFIQEVGVPDQELSEALQDVKLAVGELRRGLDLLAWVSHWLIDQAPSQAISRDAGALVKRVQSEGTPVVVTVRVESDESLYAYGVEVAVEVLRILLHNTRATVPDGVVCIRVFNDGDAVVIEYCDTGEALGQDLRERAFTMAGQKDLKGRPDGRYSRFAGFFVSAIALQSVGASIEGGGESGAAIFTIRLRSAPPTDL